MTPEYPVPRRPGCRIRQSLGRVCHRLMLIARRILKGKLIAVRRL